MPRPSSSPCSGPTASGKSALGLALAERYGGEIINCDSTAVYRGFDIGTDKLPLDAAAGHPAPPDRHRRPDRGVHRRAVCARRRARRFATSTRRGQAADSGRRHRLLLPGADARPVSRARRRRGAARPAGPDCGRGGARSACTGCCSASIPTPPRASCRATGSGWCARSRSTSSTGRPLTDALRATRAR